MTNVCALYRHGLQEPERQLKYWYAGVSDTVSCKDCVDEMLSYDSEALMEKRDLLEIVVKANDYELNAERRGWLIEHIKYAELD